MKIFYIKNLSLDALIADIKIIQPEWSGEGEIKDGFLVGKLIEAADVETGNIYYTNDYYAALVLPDDTFDRVKVSSEIVRPRTPFHMFLGYEGQYDLEHAISKETVVKDIAFGKGLILDYLAENKLLNIPTSASLQQLQKFQAVKMLLESGAIQAAHDLLEAVSADEVFTEERKTIFIGKLKTHLGKQ